MDKSTRASMDHMVGAQIFGRRTMPLILIALRGLTILGKFSLTLFVARYLGLNALGGYGLVSGAVVLAPVLLGFGVINALGRKAIKIGVAGVVNDLLLYWGLVLAVYAILGGGFLLLPVGQQVPVPVAVLLLILYMEHVQTDAFFLLTSIGDSLFANLMNFVRSAVWILIYIPISIMMPSLRHIDLLFSFWCIGLLLATTMLILKMERWDLNLKLFFTALKKPAVKNICEILFRSKTLYANDVLNTLSLYSDRYLIGWLLGEKPAGIYILFWSIGNALSNLISIGVLQDARKTLVKARDNGIDLRKPLYNTLFATFWWTVGLGSSAAVVIIAILPALHRPELLNFANLSFAVVAAFIFRMQYEALGIAMYATHRDGLTFLSGAILFVVSCCLNIAGVSLFGIWGAAASLVLSCVAGVLVRAFMLSRLLAQDFRAGIGAEG